MFFNNKAVGFITVFLLFSLIKNGSASECWDCDSHENMNCKDPFRAGPDIFYVSCGDHSLNSQRCRKLRIPLENGAWRIVRGCDDNTFRITSDMEVNFCDGSKCNAAGSHLPFVVIIIGASILAVAMNLFK